MQGSYNVEKRKLQLEMAQLQKMEAKSMKYHSNSASVTKSLANSETCNMNSNKKSEEDPRQRKLPFTGSHKITKEMEELQKDDNDERGAGNTVYISEDSLDCHPDTVPKNLEEKELENDANDEVNEKVVNDDTHDHIKEPFFEESQKTFSKMKN